jgi:2-hydroxychromene-2-carboxylate isomerase
MTSVDFYFDVLCPWAYQGSKWIRAVRAERDVDVTWRFFSLEELRTADGTRHPWERPWSYGWSLLRVAAYLRREAGGNDAVEQFYAVAGRMFHEEGRPVHTRDGVEMVTAELGLAPGTVDAALADGATNEDVRADHERALRLGVFGVPTLVLDETDVLFGPVVTPAPVGAAAGRLWDAVTAWREFPHLYEIQRPKSAEEQAHIATVFAPYAVARAQDRSDQSRGRTGDG